MPDAYWAKIGQQVEKEQALSVMKVTSYSWTRPKSQKKRRLVRCRKLAKK